MMYIPQKGNRQGFVFDGFLQYNLRIMKSVFCILIILALVSSCKLFEKSNRNIAPPKFGSINKSSGFMVYDATRRGSFYMIDYDSNIIKVLSEPPPDVVTSLIAEMKNKLKSGEKYTVESEIKYTEAITQLTKRTASVSILRDALYKLAEIKISNRTIDSVTANIFFKTLEVANGIALTELEAERNEAKEKEIKLAQIADASELKARNKVTKALLFENKGFQALLDKDIDSAIKAFDQSENTYNGFHNVYDIANYLKEVKRTRKAAIDWKTIYTTIKEKYSWGMPIEYINQF